MTCNKYIHQNIYTSKFINSYNNAPIIWAYLFPRFRRSFRLNKSCCSSLSLLLYSLSLFSSTSSSSSVLDCELSSARLFCSMMLWYHLKVDLIDQMQILAMCKTAHCYSEWHVMTAPQLQFLFLVLKDILELYTPPLLPGSR